MAGPTPLPDPVLFPFEPDGVQPIRETWNFVTDILISHNQSESRRALRGRPSLSLSWQVSALDYAESERMFGPLYQNIHNRWYIPLWPYARRFGKAGAVYTPESMDDTRFDWSELVLVWKSSTIWDVMTVSAIGGSTVTLGGATTFDHTQGRVLMIPLGVGGLPNEHTWSRPRHMGVGAITFDIDVTGVPLPPVYVPSTLLEGRELLQIHPDYDKDTEKWSLASVKVGTNVGPFTYRPFAATPVVSREFTWIIEGWNKIEEFKSWLAYRKGRTVSFWAPTYNQDLTLAAAPTIGNSYIDIAECGFEEFFFQDIARSYVALLRHPSTVVPLVVTGVTSPGAGVERLALSAPLPATVPISTKLSFLLLSRLDSDAITMQYEGPELIRASIPIREVPREV